MCDLYLGFRVHVHFVAGSHVNFRSVLQMTCDPATKSDLERMNLIPRNEDVESNQQPESSKTQNTGERNQKPEYLNPKL